MRLATETFRPAQQARPRQLLRGMWSAGLAALALCSAAPLQAQEPPMQRGAALQWVRLPGTEDCLSGDVLARRVEAKLAREVFPAPSRASLLIEGHVERVGDGYRAELRMSDASGQALGTRELSSPLDSCTELSETVVVVLAVMIDPDTASHSAPPPAPPPPEPEPVQPEPPPPPPPARQRLMGFARLGVGILPDAALGFGVAYELGFARWGGLRIEGVTYLQQDERVPDSTGLRAQLRIAHAGVAYCPLWLQENNLRVAGCLGGELGAAYSQGQNFGPGNDRSQLAAWGSGSGSARLAVKLWAALELQLGASLVIPIARGYEAVNEDGEVKRLFSPAAVAGTFDLGLGARF